MTWMEINTMSKKYYSVEFNVFMAAWAENEDEAYDIARRRVIDAKDNLDDLLVNYDDCVTEVESDWDYDDPDAPKCHYVCHNCNITTDSAEEICIECAEAIEKGEL